MGKIKKEGGQMCRAVNELFADEINEMKAVIAAKDEQLADKDVQLADKDVQIRTLTDRIVQLENERRIASM